MCIADEYKSQGALTLIQVYSNIFKKEGYYLEVNKKVYVQISKILPQDVSSSEVEEIVTYAVELGIFDKELFDKCGILTSKDIQRQYLNAVRSRKEIIVEEDFYLLDNDVDVAECIMAKVVFVKDGNILQKNRFEEKGDKLQINTDKLQIYSQSKVKESKVNESTVNQSIEKESKQEESKVQEIKVNNSIVEEKKENESKEVSIPSFTSSLINNYTNNSTLSSLLTSYMEYRVKNNLDMSEKYINNLIHLLDKLADNDEQKIIIVDTALKKNWKSFFPIDFERIEKTTPPPNRDYIRGNENFDDEYLFGL